MLLQTENIFSQNPGNLNMQLAFPGKESTRSHSQTLGPSSTKEIESAEVLETWGSDCAFL